MLGLFLCFFVFLGLSGFVSKKITSKYHAEHLVGIVLAMIVLYICACMQQLQLGVYFVFALAVLGIIGSLRILIFGGENRFVIFRQAFELASFCALAFIFSWGAEYWVWDEFSHWGVVLDYLTMFNNLPTDKDLLLFPDYTPGITLVRYFAGKLAPDLGVSSYYFVTWLFVLAALYCTSFSVSRTKWMVSIVVVFFSYLFFFQSLTLTLLVDPLQALLFLCALRYSQEKDDESFKVVVLTAVAVVLLKHVGLILGGCVWLYYVSVRVFIDKSALKVISGKAVILLMSVILTYASWMLYVYIYELNVKFSVVSVFGGDGFISNMSIGLTHVLNNLFPHAIFLTPDFPLAFLTPGISLWVCICVFTSVAFLVNLNCRSFSRSSMLAFVFLMLTTIGYVLFLSYTAVSFSWLGDHLAFTRYFVVLFFATFLLQYFVARDNLSLARCSLVAVMMAMASYVVSPPLGSVFVQSKRLPVVINEEYQQKTAQLKKYTVGGDAVLYIDGKYSSLGYFIFRSKALPLKLNDYKSTEYIYRPTKNDAARIERFKSNLCHFEYVYVDDAADEFWGRYGSAFDRVGGHIYKVAHESEYYCKATFVS